MTPKDRFYALRKKVMQAIEREPIYCFGQKYKGTFEWTTCYPNDDSEGIVKPNFYVLNLHCYVLGAFRHYSWSGETREKVLDKAEREINQWLN